MSTCLILILTSLLIIMTLNTIQYILLPKKFSKLRFKVQRLYTFSVPYFLLSAMIGELLRTHYKMAASKPTSQLFPILFIFM